MLYHSAELIKNAIGFDTQLSESKKKSPNSLFMHQLYGVCRFDNQMFLYKLSIDEFYSTDKQNEFQGTNDRVYNVKGIKITPVDFTGFQSHGTPSKDGSDLSGATVVSIPQLYSLVKTYDKNFYENPSAVGRAERLNELEIDRTVQAAVVQYAEPENDVTLSPLDTKSETQDTDSKNKIPTEEEKQFMQADLARFLAEYSLSSDEWESMAYPLFENGYTDDKT